jgi:hypothetical protein
VDLLLARAVLGECDLVVLGKDRRYLMVSNGVFTSNRLLDGNITAACLLDSVRPGRELTYLCVPPGSGTRIALDRDNDGVRDIDDGTLN